MARPITDWRTVSPAELAGTKSTLEPAAAAEATEFDINVDDSDWPRNRKEVRYIRYKIFDPEKAQGVMRLAEPVISYDGNKLISVRMAARLHQPDGSIRDFGEDSVREREVARKGAGESALRRFFTGEGLVFKEKYLAVGGAQPGAVLEYAVETQGARAQTTTLQFLQINELPVRSFHYHQLATDYDEIWFHTVYGLHSGGHFEFRPKKADAETDVVGHDLPSLVTEPLQGPLAERSATLVDAYLPKRYVRQKASARAETTRKFGPDEAWAPVATLEFWREDDHVEKNNKLVAAADRIVAGAATDLERARKIHDFVQNLHQEHRKAQTPTVVASREPAPMLEVLDSAQNRNVVLGPMDFLYLEVSLGRAAGLQAEIVMLANRGMMPFSRKLVTPAAMPDRAVAFRIGGSWHFSLPAQKNPFPFDQLLWQFEGYNGLLALDQKQEFIDAPFLPAESSQLHRRGTFQLDESGTLKGEVQMTFSGHERAQVVERLVGHPRADQLTMLQKVLVSDFDGADIEVTDIRHLHDPYDPVEVTYELTWPGFAPTTGTQMVIRPFVFSTVSTSPFSATERHNDIVDSFQHMENDELTIALPPGYKPEVKNAPPSYPGPILSYEVSLAMERDRPILHVTRKKVIKLVSALPASYGAIKHWYDAVAESDQHTLVLTPEKPAPAGVAPASGGTP
ncbi:MAG TPA: hypothetical protein VGM73_09190 [Candidatus Didemnitutus sp.]